MVEKGSNIINKAMLALLATFFYYFDGPKLLETHKNLKHSFSLQFDKYRRQITFQQ
jgi:hypothetical protein